jgi:hypothetical protein
MIPSRHLVFVIPLLLSTAPTNTALAQTTSSVKCDDGSVVAVSTGTSGGACHQPPAGVGLECGDVDNQAIGGCDNGKARCGGTTGVATCNITSNTEPNGGGEPLTTGTINTGPNGRKPVTTKTKTPRPDPRKIAKRAAANTTGSDISNNNNNDSSGAIKELLEKLFR